MPYQEKTNIPAKVRCIWSNCSRQQDVNMTFSNANANWNFVKLWIVYNYMYMYYEIQSYVPTV